MLWVAIKKKKRILMDNYVHLIYLFIYLFSLFAFSRAALLAHGGSQARGGIRAIATSLRQSHSNLGSNPRLQPTPQLAAMLDP